MAGTIGAAAGPALGGVLTQLFDWRAIFVVQVPLALVALAAMTDARVRDLAPILGKRAPDRTRSRPTQASGSSSERLSGRYSFPSCS